MGSQEGEAGKIAATTMRLLSFREMLLPLVLFLLFTVLSTAGAYLVLSRHVSRAAGLWGAVATFAFFVVLAGALVWLLRGGGLL